MLFKKKFWLTVTWNFRIVLIKLKNMSVLMTALWKWNFFCITRVVEKILISVVIFQLNEPLEEHTCVRSTNVRTWELFLSRLHTFHVSRIFCENWTKWPLHTSYILHNFLFRSRQKKFTKKIKMVLFYACVFRTNLKFVHRSHK